MAVLECPASLGHMQAFSFFSLVAHILKLNIITAHSQDSSAAAEATHDPCRCAEHRQKEVDALSAAESERSTQALQLRQGFTTTALELLTQQGPAIRARLLQLTQQLLRLLDGFVMPADLVGSPQDLGDAVARPISSGSVTLAGQAPPQPMPARYTCLPWLMRSDLG